MAIEDGTSKYHFFGSCPHIPEVWFLEWVVEESEDIDFDKLEEALEGEPDFEGYMRQREEIGIHPRDDWSIEFWEGKTPRGVPFLVIQDAGIEHVWVGGDVDLDAEEAVAKERGFWYLAENPSTVIKKLKNRGGTTRSSLKNRLMR